MFLTPLTPTTAAQRVEQFRTLFPIAANASNGRAEHAAKISTAQMVETTEDPTVFLVHSESNELGVYIVDTRTKTCTCPDHGRSSSAGVICKHRLAVAFLLNLIQPTPAPVPVTKADKARELAGFDATPPVIEPTFMVTLFRPDHTGAFNIVERHEFKSAELFFAWQRATPGWHMIPTRPLTKFERWEASRNHVTHYETRPEDF